MFRHSSDSLVKHIASADMPPVPPRSACPEESVGFSRMVSQVLAPLGEGSLLAGVFTLVSSAMGAGCLSLPFMIKRAGVWSGILMLVMSAVLAHLSLVVLMSCARYTDSDSMARLVAVAQEGGTGRVVDVVIAVYGIAAVLCYIIFIGDFFFGIARAPLLNLDVSRETLVVAVSVAVVWPLSLPRSLSALRYVCVLSVGAICLTAVAVACKAPSYIHSEGGGKGTETQQHSEGWELKWWSTDPYDALQSFSIALFAFAAHTNAVPVAISLKKADGGSIWRVSLLSVCIELVFYLLMGLGGYLSFRGYTKQDFILNYRDDDTVMFLVRCIYGVVVCLGAPINLSPAASSILGLLSGRGRHSSHASHCLVVTVIVAACVCVAILSEHVADVIGLIGASFGSLIVLAWPAMIYRKALFDLHPPCLARFVFYTLTSSAILGLAAFLAQATTLAVDEEWARATEFSDRVPAGAWAMLLGGAACSKVALKASWASEEALSQCGTNSGLAQWSDLSQNHLHSRRPAVQSSVVSMPGSQEAPAIAHQGAPATWQRVQPAGAHLPRHPRMTDRRSQYEGVGQGALMTPRRQAKQR
eukprot:CAMPEP_0179018572 /NCGR_PEP_ID=MMETSP0796-20121207/4422_1 /TAXON_ID=73915 /ORGANISM="Pyrodinium bahamense, Strain pbaha01" /LENGTH=585 /DNA_ID=CAMNT_0020714333 /DNA_START=339 /DNA_END=2094 /DNA_ORIENTATION=-